jgi:HK97 family phage major capsid protein
MTIQELNDKRNEVLARAREINEKAEGEGRELTAEESQNFSAAMDEVNELRDKMTAMQNAEERAVKIEEAGKFAGESRGRKTINGEIGATRTDEGEVRKMAYRKFLAHGKDRLTQDELRALQADNDAGGGYTIPDEFMPDLIKFVDDATFMPSISTVMQTNYGASLGIPSLDTDVADADWTPEIASVSEGTLVFGKRELSPHGLSKLVKLSRPLIRSSAIDIEQLVLERLGYKHAVASEKAFMTGSGAQQPLGIFTASDQGISTTYDISTGNTTTSITFDGLKEAKYDLKAAYWPRASWIFHRNLIKQLSKLKDGEGQYIWQQSVVGGDPDMLLGFPMRVSEYAPSAPTTGEYAGILGDFSKYYIAQSLSASVQRLDELYAANNQVGFIGRMEVDGMPVLGEAFRRVTLA